VLRATKVTQHNVKDKDGIDCLAFDIEILDATTGNVYTAVVENVYDNQAFLDAVEVGIAQGTVPDSIESGGIPIMPLGSYPQYLEHFAVGHALVHAAQYATLRAAAGDKLRVNA
jgi:hypothetical protein